MAFTIEKDIPVPQSIHHRTKYMFRDMEIGDSFTFPTKVVSNIRTASSWFAKRNEGYKFKIRTINEDYARIWRVECQK